PQAGGDDAGRGDRGLRGRARAAEAWGVGAAEGEAGAVSQDAGSKDGGDGRADPMRTVNEGKPTSQRRPRPDLKGWKDIANRLGVSVDTAQRYYHLPVDPLPVVKDRFGRPMAFSSAIDAWMDRELIPGRVYDELRTLR